MLSSNEITERIDRIREIMKERPTEELQKETLNLALDLLESFLLTQRAILQFSTEK